MELEMLEEDPSILDSLSEMLQRIDGVEYAGTIIEHPLTKRVLLRVKTDSSKLKASEAVMKTLQELKQLSAQLREEFEKL
ncbi:MAG: hypothetical protein J7L79_01975 [Thaumarchaeota archaeon]|nr:hypothetical protein [Nitrososphaerota archaeon]